MLKALREGNSGRDRAYASDYSRQVSVKLRLVISLEHNAAVYVYVMPCLILLMSRSE